MSSGKTFGERVRELRIAKGLTQRQLADAVALRVLKSDEGRGFDFTYLSKIENDRMKPSIAAITQLAHVLGADADELLALAGRLPKNLGKALTESSGARAFLRSAQELNLSEADWKKLLAELERRKKL